MAINALAKEVKAIPEGYQTVTPYLTVDDTSKLIEFLKNAFDAKIVFTMNDETGTPGHAEVKVGTSMVMMGKARGEWKALPCSLYLYVPDVDATYKKAIAAGGTSIREVADQFYGDRSGGVLDPCGNSWWIGTHIEDVSEEELERRSQEWAKTKA
jgi:uncharacterized glyoxalase superfamily protein PhnB